MGATFSVHQRTAELPRERLVGGTKEQTAAEDNGATVTHSSNEHMAAIDSTVEVQYLVTATEDAHPRAESSPDVESTLSNERLREAGTSEFDEFGTRGHTLDSDGGDTDDRRTLALRAGEHANYELSVREHAVPDGERAAGNEANCSSDESGAGSVDGGVDENENEE
ncbi:hypothetical protein PHYSODRAFT_344211 [Phytophthora sojae]|uniref:Uncharacterized protein n=1 Tax=Phytophthora sojae (strain P6497) TaxID=1094619 RepID=G4YQL9_PHYSP|nr:hypothetical protein PHYSODRAFT_344211 [Phytophthora sojae]EGZ30283.1 hypothetical protein PHYSODRAFT_344211 [Phytophthora sojae]|eukprot:XP_009517558.1 hypothetical protein PHYSODRAFT_344211 [Phytophthora sojae]